jgi:hypothetical protein
MESVKHFRGGASVSLHAIWRATLILAATAALFSASAANAQTIAIVIHGGAHDG